MTAGGTKMPRELARAQFPGQQVRCRREARTRTGEGSRVWHRIAGQIVFHRIDARRGQQAIERGRHRLRRQPQLRGGQRHGLCQGAREIRGKGRPGYSLLAVNLDAPSAIATLSQRHEIRGRRSRSQPDGALHRRRHKCEAGRRDAGFPKTARGSDP